VIWKILFSSEPTIIEPAGANGKPAVAVIAAPENRSHFPRGAFKLTPAQVMKFTEQLQAMFRAPKLTRTRIVLAVAVAVTADSLQFFLGPVGWAFPDQAIDLLAMLLTAWAIGFHLLLLPTFIAELFPVVDMLPTWTACVIAVIALRKREQRTVSPPPLKDGRE
jgi:hypothetical protein